MSLSPEKEREEHDAASEFMRGLNDYSLFALFQNYVFDVEEDMRLIGACNLPDEVVIQASVMISELEARNIIRIH